jgi:prefoldin subunit 5
MKIAKALKQKNLLAGEVGRLKDLLKQQNVRPSRQRFDYDNAEVLRTLRARIDELVRTKAAIAAANAEIYEKIFRLSELKGLIATLREMDTRHGVFVEPGGYGQNGIEIDYVAQIGKAEIDRQVADIEKEAQALQDALDEFNATRSVTV